MKGGEGKIGEGVGEEEQEGKRSGEEGGLDVNKEEVEEEKRGAGRKESLGLSMARLNLVRAFFRCLEGRI